jgi:hypothetical protein
MSSSCPMYLVPDTDSGRMHILHGEDAPPSQSKYGVFMRGLPNVVRQGESSLDTLPPTWTTSNPMPHSSMTWIDSTHRFYLFSISALGFYLFYRLMDKSSV